MLGKIIFYFSEFLNFLEANMVLFQAIAYVILTTLLTIFTFKYMKYTKKMADIMKEEFDLRTKPVVELDIRSYKQQPDPPIVNYELYIKNSGEYRVEIEIVGIKYWHALNPEDAKAKPIHINKVIQPKMFLGPIEFEIDFSEFKKYGTGYSLMEKIFCEPTVFFKDVRNLPHRETKKIFIAK